jgi:hypothetical protein
MLPDTPARTTSDSEFDHPVKQKLKDQILPWLESAKLLHKQWFYRLHVLFGYATDVTVALGAIGISFPLITILTQPSGKADGANANVLAAIPHNSRWLYLFIAACVVAWVILRVTFNREDGAKKAVLAKSCRQTMKQLEAKLFHILTQTDPMLDLNKMVVEQIAPTVDRNIQEGSWPWPGPAPGIDPVVNERLRDLCERFSSRWSKVDFTGMRS